MSSRVELRTVRLCCWLSGMGLLLGIASAMVNPGFHSEEQPVHLNSSDHAMHVPTIEDIILVNSTSVPFYELVYYFTRETMQKEPQVHDLNIAYYMYYTHMYFAWMQVDPRLSMVAVSNDYPKNPNIYGANMVLSTNGLSSMYAPGNIAHVLVFVRHCYDHVRREERLSDTVESFVSTLRTTASTEINRKLISETAKKFKGQTALGSYHLVWENQTVMHTFLTREGYKKILCGVSSSPSNPCDWSRVGLSPEMAKDLCIYLLVNKSS